jgi:hypothetical protein
MLDVGIEPAVAAAISGTAIEIPASGNRRPYSTASDRTGQYEACADEMAAPIEQRQAASQGFERHCAHASPRSNE